MDSNDALKRDIDLVSRTTGLGTLSESAANALYGINHRGVGNPVPYNTDNHGLTFFTRPRLNLSYDNVSMDRVLAPLLTRDPNTYQRAIRLLLDPIIAGSDFVRSARATSDSRRLESGENDSSRLLPLSSPLVDTKNPFIAMLTNNLMSLNGWPDVNVATFTSKEGPMKETWSMVDDVSIYYGSFDLQASFRNIAGDPITLLFNTWVRYMSNVYTGLMLPYPDAMIENEIDYQTRIYRVTLDPSRQYVQKIAACGAAFPTAVPLGAAFNFSEDQPFVSDNAQQLSIPFRASGAIYNDPILIKEFNELVIFYNQAMRVENRATQMKRLSQEELISFNYSGYPRIDPFTNRLEWYVPIQDYVAFTRQRFTTGAAAPTTPGP